MYTAAVLTDNSADLLRLLTEKLLNPEADGFRFETPQGEPLPHHMTINLGQFDGALNDRSLLGRPAQVDIEVIGINRTMGVCAAVVTGARALTESPHVNSPYWVELKSKNKKPHVTICLMPGVKAKTSNDMLEGPSLDTVFTRLPRKYTLEAFVREVE